MDTKATIKQKALCVSEYASIALMVLRTRSIFLHSDLNAHNFFTLAFFALLAVAVGCSVLIKGVDFDKIWNCPHLVLLLPYVAFFVALRPTAILEDAYYALSAFLVFLFALNNAEGRGENLLHRYVNVVLVIAVTSTVMWALCLKTGVIKPVNSFYSAWTGNAVDNYWWVFFATQSTRNTAIFTEAPMSSLHFSLALLIEVYLTQKPSALKIALLAVAILTTTSTTGYILLCLVGGIKILSYKPTTLNGSVAKQLTVYLCAFVIPLVCLVLLRDKLSSGSGIRRAEDVWNCLNVWLAHPLFGVGGGDVAENLLGGSSNSIGRLLAERGIYFGWFYLYCFGRYVYDNRRDFNKQLFALLFFAVFCITIIQYTDVTFLVLAYFRSGRQEPKLARRQRALIAQSESVT